MKSPHYLTLLGLVCALGLGACQSAPKDTTTALLGAAGAYLGSELSDGEPEGALLGAAAGVAAGSLLNYWQSNNEREAFTDGYDLGRNDEVKRLYWTAKRLHHPDFQGGFDLPLERSYYEIPVAEHVSNDGVIIEPHTQVVEVVE